VLLLIAMPIGWLSGDQSTGDMIAFVVATLISLGLIAAMLLWFMPRERAAGREARTSLILGVVSIVLAPVFWTGLTFSVGAGAVALGLGAREAPEGASGRGQATAAVVLGTIGLLGAFAALLFG
jgi:hypothetical protein